ncbi:GNAT family N-acetyltransferase [Propionicimonas sp.]|uniref:GNAT family N-acetyltransferase n=1 Tax=Propionicimonas sp. TaxID=1955623 RepID=UPI0039E70556
MRRTRLLEGSDATVLAEVLIRTRAFLEPWEPVRPDSYFTAAGQADAVADSLRRHAAGTMHPRVILDDAGAVVGRINLNNIVRGAFQSASVGYWLAEEAGGRGYATQAVAEIVDVAFGDLHLHRLEAGTIPDNVRSQAVLHRNGFSRFGYAPAYLQIRGRYTDHLLFQRLAPG